MHRKNPPDFRHASFHGRVGVARTDITPPVGIYARNWGAAKHDLADSIHRPLTLTALTLSSLDGGSPLVLVDADLGWWKSPLTAHTFLTRLQEALNDSARLCSKRVAGGAPSSEAPVRLTPNIPEASSRRGAPPATPGSNTIAHGDLALPSANLIFALSHTHSGPPLMDADDSLPGSELHRMWMETLFESTVNAVRQALETQFEATLDWHAGRCGLATIRDLPDPNPVCGFNPDVTPDDTLLVGRITDSAGVVRATLVNYACHPTTLAWDNTAISPDYVGAMRETIQQATDAPALFLLGVCGELAPRYQYVGNPEIADGHGRQLGFAALSTLQGMEPSGTRLAYSETVESGAPLAVWKHSPRELSRALRAVQTTVELPLKNWPSADELEQQRSTCTDRALEERSRRKRDIRRSLGDGSRFELPISVWRIGDAVLVGSCCEPYSILQRELRQRFSGQTIICMNLINGSIGYLPPEGLYDTDVYPVWQTPFDRGSLEKTLESMTQAIHDVLTQE